MSVQLRNTLSRNASKHKRTASAINVVNSIIPGIANRISRWMFKNKRIPREPVDVELISAGSGAAVFELILKNSDKVLRIYRKSLGKSPLGLLEMAKCCKRNDETVLSWYSRAKDLVLPMEFLVLQGQPLLHPIAAFFQVV